MLLLKLYIAKFFVCLASKFIIINKQNKIIETNLDNSSFLLSYNSFIESINIFINIIRENIPPLYIISKIVLCACEKAGFPSLLAITLVSSVPYLKIHFPFINSIILSQIVVLPVFQYYFFYIFCNIVI